MLQSEKCADMWRFYFWKFAIKASSCEVRLYVGCQFPKWPLPFAGPYVANVCWSTLVVSKLCRDRPVVEGISSHTWCLIQLGEICHTFFGGRAGHDIFHYPIGSMYGIYKPTFTIKSTIHVGKYTSPMDPMGMLKLHNTQNHWLDYHKSPGRDPVDIAP